MNLSAIENLFNKAPNGGGFRSSVVQPLFAPVLTNCAVAARGGGNWQVISAAAASSPTIVLNYALSGCFAPGSGSGTKGIPSLRLRVRARMVDTGGAVGGLLVLQGAARFHSPVWSLNNLGVETAGIAGDVASAAATLVCQDQVNVAVASQNNALANVQIDTVFSNLRVYEYDPLAGLTAAQRALLTPETTMQITLSTSIAIPANSQLNIFSMTLEERRHVGLWSKFRRCTG